MLHYTLLRALVPPWKLHYSPFGAFALPGNFPDVLMIGPMINSLQFPEKPPQPVSSGLPSLGPHLHLAQPVPLTDLYKRHEYPAPPILPL